MSDMIVYDVSIDPSPAPIDLTIAATGSDGTDLQVTVSSVPSLTALLTPTGNIIQKILSAVAYPVAQLIALAVKDKPKDALQGKTTTFYTVDPFDTHGIRITPSNIVLGSATPAGTAMLKATLTMTLTAIPQK